MNVNFVWIGVDLSLWTFFFCPWNVVACGTGPDKTLAGLCARCVSLVLILGGWWQDMWMSGLQSPCGTSYWGVACFGGACV